MTVAHQLRLAEDRPILKLRERRCLLRMSAEPDAFLHRYEFRAGTGTVTLERLADLGLAEKGRSTRFDDDRGWRITAAGLEFLASGRSE